MVLSAVLVVVLIAWNNVLVHRFPGQPGSYVPVNLLAAGALLVGVRALGWSWAELGRARSALPAGLRWGGACAAVVAAGYAVAVAVPASREALRGGRDAAGSTADVLDQVLVRIPLGTVVWEEIAFRGVLLAVLLRWLRPAVAVGVSAVVFGLWHIRPALGGLPVDGVADGAAGQGLSVVLTCTGTAAAGVLLGWLRLRSGSILAPALLHLSTNAGGTVAAVAAYRWG
ncbi:CAAX protease self-immunity [Blastococcus fimeti]|nr:CAAX protease self-immunity [Blastococcus fimeti]